MKIPFTLLAFLFACFTFGQTNLNDLERVDGRWKKKGDSTSFTGPFVEYFDNGKIKGTGEFRDGLVEGNRIMYNEQGTVVSEKKFTAGQTNGRSIEYFDNGKPKQEGQFRYGKEHGTWNLFYETGGLRATLNFFNGTQDGDYYEYSEDGLLTAQYYFTDGEAGYSPQFMDLTKQAEELSRQLRNKEAIALYDKAIWLNPTVAQAYFNRGACKGNDFDFAGAIKDYDKAIELKPDYMEAYGNRGNAKINTYTANGNTKPTAEQTASACEDFHKAVSLGDKSIGTADMIYLYCNKKNK